MAQANTTKPIKNVALCAPTGQLGPQLLDALKNEGFTVTAIIRASSKAAFPPEQKIVRVADDYPKEELVSAFQGQDAVVLSLPFQLLGDSKKFAEASIAAGCRWLIPSTYGANLDEPKYADFPASISHKQIVSDLKDLEKGHDNWAWTSISCGPWADLAVAAGAWNIDPVQKTAQLVDNGSSAFTVSTRKQVTQAAARILSRQPLSMKNTCIFVASVEASMSVWLDAYKQVVGSEGWKVTNIDGKTLLENSKAQLASGEFHRGYMGSALVVCTTSGYANHFSSFTTLANEELGLRSDEDPVEILKVGMALPNPFAYVETKGSLVMDSMKDA